MGFAVLELVQRPDGKIVLQAGDNAAPLLTLEFGDELTEILGADALSLAQTMVESAGYTFEYSLERAKERESSRNMPADPSPIDPPIRLRSGSVH